jgi:hypothetical protein
MSCNLGTIIGGPAVVKFKGKTFYSKGDIQLVNDVETFAVEVDAFGGAVEQREANAPMFVSFTPAGEWENLSVLWPYGDPVIGGSIVAVTTITAVDTGTNVLTAPKHRLRDGAPVRFAVIGGTIVTGLTAGTLYYAHVLTADTFSVHTSEANALANTSAVDITGAGTGDTQVVEQEPLTIHTLAGKKITFFVAAVTQQPDFLGSAVQSPIGAVQFEIFRKNGTAASVADSRYTVATEAFAFDSTFDPAQIITQPYEAAWGSSPWDAFSSKNGFRVSFPISLSAIEDDACGVIGRRLSGVAAEVRGQPTNISEADALTALKLQGTGAGRGRRMVGSNLNLVGTGVYVRVYGATLVGAPMGFGSAIDRAGEFTWRSARTFAAGLPGPVFHVGTEAPA